MVVQRTEMGRKENLENSMESAFPSSRFSVAPMSDLFDEARDVDR
jgi:hypothetical protein